MASPLYAFLKPRSPAQTPPTPPPSQKGTRDSSSSNDFALTKILVIVNALQQSIDSLTQKHEENSEQIKGIRELLHTLTAASSSSDNALKSTTTALESIYEKLASLNTCIANLKSSQANLAAAFKDSQTLLSEKIALQHSVVSQNLRVNELATLIQPIASLLPLLQQLVDQNSIVGDDSLVKAKQDGTGRNRSPEREAYPLKSASTVEAPDTAQIQTPLLWKFHPSKRIPQTDAQSSAAQPVKQSDTAPSPSQRTAQKRRLLDEDDSPPKRRLSPFVRASTTPVRPSNTRGNQSSLKKKRRIMQDDELDWLEQTWQST